jgi:hypothetical protein
MWRRVIWYIGRPYFCFGNSKRSYLSTKLHGLTSQKTVILKYFWIRRHDFYLAMTENGSYSNNTNLYKDEVMIPLRRPGFESRSGHVRFVVDKVALEQVSTEYFGFTRQFSFHPSILIPPTAPCSLIILSSTLYSLDNNSVVKKQTKKQMISNFPSRRNDIASVRMLSRWWRFLLPKGLSHCGPSRQNLMQLTKLLSLLAVSLFTEAYNYRVCTIIIMTELRKCSCGSLSSQMYWLAFRTRTTRWRNVDCDICVVWRLLRTCKTCSDFNFSRRWILKLCSYGMWSRVMW